jgi:hypothetical protein
VLHYYLSSSYVCYKYKYIQFVCEEYHTTKDGITKIRSKGKGDCTRLAPFTAGFNEAACDIFHGTFCPTPRDCRELRECIKDLKKEVGINGDRLAFFEYLDGAPEILDERANDPEECGKYREYFEYDHDFPDDGRICEEVEELQCFTDFSNLDGFATGAVKDAKDEKLELIKQKFLPFHLNACSPSFPPLAKRMQWAL